MAIGLTDITGIKVGVASNLKAATGVTVVLIEDGAQAAVEVRGSAPGTRETDLLNSCQLVREIQALVLSGGSAFGLDSAAGVMKYLEEKGSGFSVGPLVVPIVPAAVLFDLFIGDCNVRPDAAMGYQACLAASEGSVPEGSVGAGTGATVGKINGMASAVKTGQGSAAIVRGDLIVAALAAVNAFGDIYNEDNTLMAGPRNSDTGIMEKTIDLLVDKDVAGFPGNTTLGVIATNANFNNGELRKICQLAHDGLARSIWPVHTMWDGDTIFALSKGELNTDLNLVGLMAAEAIAMAVRRAALTASSLAGIPALSDLK
ncbi:MAG: P1 family peptidase [Dethiobacteria bacterium]|nr:P1 family peptidase [Bacillota bacterium]MDW7729397.1 P1 family peptidase [Bacillota bacterium]